MYQDHIQDIRALGLRYLQLETRLRAPHSWTSDSILSCALMVMAKTSVLLLGI